MYNSVRYRVKTLFMLLKEIKWFEKVLLIAVIVYSRQTTNIAWGGICYADLLHIIITLGR